MRSILTRRVLRQMTQQVLYADTRCLYLPAKRRCLHWQNARTPTLYLSQNRSLFGFSRKAKRRPKPANFKPGFEIMLKLNQMLKLGERTPPQEELAEAFVALFNSQYKMDGAYSQLEDAQIETAIATFEYLQKTYTKAEGFGIQTDQLRMALQVLHRGSSKAHKRMATLIFEELEMRRQIAISNGGDAEPLHVNLLPYITVLCQNDEALLARDLMETYWENDLKAAKVLKDNHTKYKPFEIGPSMWMRVLSGMIRERRNDEVERTVEIMQRYNVPFDSKMHATVVSFYAHQEGDMEMTMKWYKHPIAGNAIPTNGADTNVLKLCIQKNELELGEPILAKLVERDPQDKSSLNIILQWAAAKGRGVDEIEHMMKLMKERNLDKPNLQPGMDTINALINFANMREDPYTAERYYALGEKWGFKPNARTYLLQLDYRIKVKDLSGAMAAYGRLQGEDLSDNEDVPYINTLIVAFCAQGDLRYDMIMSLIDDLSERKAPFTPEAVAALSLFYLRRNEMMDLMDLLNTHTFHFSLEQRRSVYNALLTSALASDTPEAQAWELYKILRSIFSELLDLPTRVSLMNSFFARKRLDVAVTIFSHIHQNKDMAIRPTIDTYCTCFVGLSKVGSLKAVEVVHNMMKVDSGIEPNTKLRNALMMAHIGQNNSNRALIFWEDIEHSREGPSYSSIQLALRACERGGSGEKIAKDIWRKLKRFNIDVTREIFAAYLGALAGRATFDECVDLLAVAEKECGAPVDALMLGSCYNATDDESKKQKFKDLAREEYPQAYEALLKCGMRERTFWDPQSFDADDGPEVLRREFFYDVGPLGGDVLP